MNFRKGLLVILLLYTVLLYTVAPSGKLRGKGRCGVFSCKTV